MDAFGCQTSRVGLFWGFWLLGLVFFVGFQMSIEEGKPWSFIVIRSYATNESSLAAGALYNCFSLCESPEQLGGTCHKKSSLAWDVFDFLCGCGSNLDLTGAFFTFFWDEANHPIRYLFERLSAVFTVGYLGLEPWRCLQTILQATGGGEPSARPCQWLFCCADV